MIHAKIRRWRVYRRHMLRVIPYFARTPMWCENDKRGATLTRTVEYSLRWLYWVAVVVFDGETLTRAELDRRYMQEPT